MRLLYLTSGVDIFARSRTPPLQMSRVLLDVRQ